MLGASREREGWMLETCLLSERCWEHLSERDHGNIIREKDVENTVRELLPLPAPLPGCRELFLPVQGVLTQKWQMLLSEKFRCDEFLIYTYLTQVHVGFG